MYVAGQLVREAGIGTNIAGIPSDSDYYEPLMIRGRWIMPGDGRVVVITRQTAEREGIQVGDRVTLDLGELGNEEWQVIGVYEPVFASGFVSETIYAPLDSLYRAIRRFNVGSWLYVRTTSTHRVSPRSQTSSAVRKRGLKISAVRRSPNYAAVRFSVRGRSRRC
jgi:hypothetical protein